MAAIELNCPVCGAHFDVVLPPPNQTPAPDEGLPVHPDLFALAAEWDRVRKLGKPKRGELVGAIRAALSLLRPEPPHCYNAFTVAAAARILVGALEGTVVETPGLGPEPPAC